MPGGAKILLIDDLPDTLSLLSRMIRRHLPTAEILTARSGAEGISVAELQLPDLILLDAKMPQMDGFEACRRLKQNPRTAIIPVLMVSGVMTEARDRVAGMEVGAEGYLCKPFEPEELVAQVRALLRVKAAEDELRRREQRLELQLESRTRTLQESEMRFRILFENSPTPCSWRARMVLCWTSTRRRARCTG
jgi:DNA-binding response OmpR family regulator